MQYTHDTNGNGFVEFPVDLKVKDVDVYIHDSGMIATHDYSCPVCRKNHAILHMNTGIMQPCYTCQEKGYYVVQKTQKTPTNLFNKLFKNR